jgi:hypothetical protein
MPDSTAKRRWDRQNTKQVMMKLNVNTDADIIQHLGSVFNVQGYIKSLIRADIARNEKEAAQE